jgi:hypothetical protein
MSGNSTASSAGRQDNPPPHLGPPSPGALTLLRVARYLTPFSFALLILAGFTAVEKSASVQPAIIPVPNAISVEQNVQDNALLLREDLPAYLDFVGGEVLPVMSQNIDDILQDLQGLTDVRPGFFYHGHIDYSTGVPGGLGGLMKMSNVVLQYHTLENPLIYIPYWRNELRNIHDPKIDAWLERVDEYNQAISTPSAVSGIPYTPLQSDEAAQIASSWDAHLRQNSPASPDLEMLIHMVYLIDGGKQPLYQESFQQIYQFHSIAFGPEGLVLLDNRTHLANTFSPFQITFETAGECQELLSVFAEARAAGFSYVLNLENVYIAQHPELLHDPEMAELSRELDAALSILSDDNMIKISNTSEDQQIAFFAEGNYVFAVSGSLDFPSIFK